jgi:hypothetical protein
MSSLPDKFDLFLNVYQSVKYSSLFFYNYVLFRPFFASSRSLPRGDPLEKDNPVRSGSVNPGFSILEKVIIN